MGTNTSPYISKTAKLRKSDCLISVIQTRNHLFQQMSV